MYIYSLGLRIIIYVFLHFYHLRRLEITLLSASQHAEHYGVVVVNSCGFFQIIEISSKCVTIEKCTKCPPEINICQRLNRQDKRSGKQKSRVRITHATKTSRYFLCLGILRQENIFLFFLFFCDI